MGVKEKKAAKAAQVAIDERLASLQSVCGKEFDVVFHYDQAESLDMDDRDAVNLIENAGDRIGEVLMRLTDLCADEDYKEEVVKIATIEFTPADINNPYWELALEEGFSPDISVLTVQFNPLVSPGADGADYIKEIF